MEDDEEMTVASKALLPRALDPEDIVTLVSPMPMGGARKKEGRRGRGRRSDPRHMDGTGIGNFVDAYDAAVTIGRHSSLWMSRSMLDHPEIARMGAVEALDSLVEQMRSLGWRSWMTRSGRSEFAYLSAEVEAVKAAADVLLEAHRSGLILEYWRK